MSEQIACPVTAVAKRFPDSIAIAGGEGGIGFTQLNYAIEACVQKLTEAGVDRGDIVAVLAGNSVEYAVLMWAVWRRQAVLMPLNVRLNVQQLRQQVEKTNCGLLVYDRRNSESAAGISKAAVAINELVNLEAGGAADNNDYNYPFDDDALVIFSSGSSGLPRGVVLTHGNIHYSALGCNQVLNLAKDDCWAAVLPFYHVGGISILYRCALAGSKAVIFDKFEAGQALRAIQGHGITHLSVVPTMLDELMTIDKDNVLSKMKAIILGGAPLVDKMRGEIIRRELPVLTTYGLTESASMVTLLDKEGRPDKLDSSGRVLPYRKIKIGDDGHIWIGGEVLFSKLLGESGNSKIDEWYRTEDIGKIDSDGYLQVLGRADDFIISGGENINLNEIEKALLALSDIKAAVVMGRPDDKWGQRPVAFVQCPGKPDAHDIKKGLESKLAKIMIPDEIIIVEALPLTGSGKVDRTKLMDKYQTVFGNNR